MKVQQDTVGDRMARIRELIERQAADDGCWFQAQTCAEAYLQSQLRMLHAAIEGTDMYGRKLWTDPAEWPSAVGATDALNRRKRADG